MYIYKELKNMLMGNRNLNGRSVVKDWSPNSIKAIVIMRDFIFIAYHIKQPRYKILNPEEVMIDFSKNGSGGSLHNLLAQKQLSCLEEIYVDGAFQNYVGLMDLVGYVKSLVNSRSRLRYFGYVGNLDCNELQAAFSKAQAERIIDYTYALDPNRKATLMYESTNNSNWYSKFNLRPEIYALDAPKGTLCTYFNMVQKKVEEEKRKELVKLEGEGIDTAILALFKQDISYAESILQFFTLKKQLPRIPNDSITADVLKAINSVKIENYLTKVSILKLEGIAKQNGLDISPRSKSKFVLTSYSKLGIFSKEEQNLDLEKLVARVNSCEGFLGFPSYLCDICCKLVQKPKNTLDDTSMMLYLTLSNMGLLKSENDLLKVMRELRNSSDCVEVYTTLLLALCGYTGSSIIKFERWKVENGN